MSHSFVTFIKSLFADRLADVYTDIFNTSLLQSLVHTCFRRTPIVPVPKKVKALSGNDFRPLALTSVIMKTTDGEVKQPPLHYTSSKH